jgi:hypothetical protein
MADLAHRCPRQVRKLRTFQEFRTFRSLAAALAATGVALAGCSTVQGDWNQHLQIEVLDAQDHPVDDMRCVVGEGSSAQTVTTPARDVRVHRAAAPLAVDCHDAAARPGRDAIATVKSRRGRMEEALLPFGSVGVFVDHLSGALYEYPARLQLRLGQRLVLEHGVQSQVASAESLPAPPTPVVAAPPPPVAAAAVSASRTTSAAHATPKTITVASAPKPAQARASASAPQKPARKTTPNAAPNAAPGAVQKVALATPSESGAIAPARTAPVNW